VHACLAALQMAIGTQRTNAQHLLLTHVTPRVPTSVT
jgi:hypothetical protein